MLRQIIDWIYYSELPVSLSGGFLSAYVFLSVAGKMNWGLTFFTIAGIFVAYTVERLATLAESGNPFFDQKLRWQNKRLRSIYFSLAVAFIAAGVLLYNLHLRENSFVILGVVGLFFVLYSFCPEAIKKNFRENRFRFLGKTLLLVFSWLAFTVILPLNEASGAGAGNFSNSVVVYAFSWLLINAMIFDLRDIQSDKRKKIQTFPLIFGRSFSIILVLIFDWILIFTFLTRKSELSLQDVSIILPNFFYALALFHLLLYRSRRTYPFYLCIDLILAVPFFTLLLLR